MKGNEQKSDNPDRQGEGISRRMALRLFAAGAAGVFLKTTSCMAKTAMLTRSIPSSGEALPVVGLGTWQTFDAGASAAERQPLEEVLALFVKMGGRVIDSSPMYGRSEQVVGEIATKLGVQPSLFLATKVWTTGKSA